MAAADSTDFAVESHQAVYIITNKVYSQLHLSVVVIFIILVARRELWSNYSTQGKPEGKEDV